MNGTTNGFRHKFVTLPGEDYFAVEIVDKLCADPRCSNPALPGETYCERCHDESDWLLELRHEQVRNALKREPGYHTIEGEGGKPNRLWWFVPFVIAALWLAIGLWPR